MKTALEYLEEAINFNISTFVALAYNVLDIG